MFQYNSLDVECGGKKDKKYGGDNYCKKYRPYYPSYRKHKYYDDYWDDCCYPPPCCCCCCCDDDDDDYDKKKDKKGDKWWKKLMKKDKKDKKNKKHKKSKHKYCKCKCCKCYQPDYCCCDYDYYDDYDCCDDKCCNGQKIIVEDGPTIIQTVIVDSDCYSKYCSGYYGDCNPLQKVIVKNGDCCKYPTCYDPYDDCCDAKQCVNVVAKDPCCKQNYYGNYGSYCY